MVGFGGLLFKILTGIFIIPLTILLDAFWPWFEKEETTRWKKVVALTFMWPFILIGIMTSDWWNGMSVK